MATAASLKLTLSFPADPLNPFIQDGRTVGDAEIARIAAWFESDYTLTDANGDPRSATANDFGAWLWRQIAAKVKNYETRVRDEASTQPEVAELTEAP